MKLNQVGSPKSHRLLQDGVIDPIRALNAGPMNELRGVPPVARRDRAEAQARRRRRLDGCTARLLQR